MTTKDIAVVAASLLQPIDGLTLNLNGCRLSDYSAIDLAGRALAALKDAGFAVVTLPKPDGGEPFDPDEGYGTASFNWGKASAVLATFPNGRVWDEDADLSIADARALAAALLAAADAAERAE